MNDYSNKDFTGQDLRQCEGLTDVIIENSCFSQETPNRHIFPENMAGVTFIDCNLDNCFLPEGNTLIRCSNRRFQVQDDGQDWLLDSITLLPLELLNPSKEIL